MQPRALSAAYDLYIYGFAAAFALGPLFFPGFSEIAQTLAAFATFAASFLARPLGAVIFGHFGDRLGRKAMLVLSLLVMGLATSFIGLLPGFDVLGVAAPSLLVVLRFLQGVSFGGEWGVVFTPDHRHGIVLLDWRLLVDLALLRSPGRHLLLLGLPPPRDVLEEPLSSRRR